MNQPMQLQYLPANACYAFVWHGNIIPVDEQRFFTTRTDAFHAATRVGLKVRRNGVVTRQEAA